MIQGDNSLEDDEETDKMKDANNFKDAEVFHMKQYIHNACGTIALIHSVANNQNMQAFY